MGLYRRGKTFWFTIQFQGKRIQQSTGTSNKKLAERIYAKALTEVEEGRWFNSEARRRRFKELIERYVMEYAIPNKAERTVEKDNCSFKRLYEFFGDCFLCEITPQRIADYKIHRRGLGIKPATLAIELEVLRASLNIAIREWEWLEINPFWKVKIDIPKNGKERWITFEEEKRLLDNSPTWLKDIIIFALNTGMRRDEILSLIWDRVDLQRKTATLIETKNKEKRTTPLNQTVTELLKQKNKVRHISGYVFASQTGTKIIPRNLLRAFHNAREKAGIQDVRFHDLRHTFATRLVQAGIDLYVVKELLGHKSIKMTMRYAHHYPETLRHGVDVLDSLKKESATILLQSNENAKNKKCGNALSS